MIAILLYLVGLIAVIVTLVLVGIDLPSILGTFSAASQTGDVLPALAHALVSINWALWPFLGGLLLMGFARIIILLGSINRALRGPA